MRPVVVLFELLLAGLAVLGFAVLDLMNHPVRVMGIINRAHPSVPYTLSLDEVELLPLGRWTEPWNWQVAVTKLEYRPKDPLKPEWRAERVVATVPELRRSSWGRVLHVPELAVTGLEIVAKQQRPPPPWTPKTGGIAAVTADHVRIVGASFEAPEDPPLGRAATSGIRGELSDLVYRPGHREISAEGWLKVARFETGSISLTKLALPTFVLDRSDLHFDGTFDFAGNIGTLVGDVEQFHIKAKVTLGVTLHDAVVDDVVSTATGTESPIDGRMDLELTVEAGGDRPRGGALMKGKVELRDGRIQLDRRTRYVILDAIRIVPWVRLNAHNQVELDTMTGEAQLTRGSAILKGLTYPVGKRSLILDGTIAQQDLYLLVRLTAVKEDRRGLGVVIEGTRQQQSFRLANREDLDAQRPWLPVPPSVDQPEAQDRTASKKAGP